MANVISDSMPATVHPATGQVTESKSEFRRWTKESGCIEVGNEKPVVGSRPEGGEGVRESIERARYEIENGRRG